MWMKNTEQYSRERDKRFLLQLVDWFADGNAILMNDGTSCHRSAASIWYLNKSGFKVLPWPGNNPDMNVIEDSVEDVKNKIHGVTVTSRRQLTVSSMQADHQDSKIHYLPLKSILAYQRA
jgi:hypothetical protein